jgi:hypothetical protein
LPESVVSNAKLIPAAPQRSIYSCISRPARLAASSGANGDRPAAIRSALMKVVMPGTDPAIAGSTETFLRQLLPGKVCCRQLEKIFFSPQFTILLAEPA